MALAFENERVVYDPEEKLLRFIAVDGVLLVRCGISKAALAVLEDGALSDPDEIVTAYFRTANSSRILWSEDTARIGLRPAGSWSFAFRICPLRLYGRKNWALPARSSGTARSASEFSMCKKSLGSFDGTVGIRLQSRAIWSGIPG